MNKTCKNCLHAIMHIAVGSSNATYKCAKTGANVTYRGTACAKWSRTRNKRKLQLSHNN